MQRWRGCRSDAAARAYAAGRAHAAEAAAKAMRSAVNDDAAEASIPQADSDPAPTVTPTAEELLEAELGAKAK